MKDIVVLNVSLLLSKPKIFRRLQVPAGLNFFKLHHTIQIAMGWHNCHLFEFNIEGYKISDTRLTRPEQFSETHVDCKDARLKDLLNRAGEKFQYLYDFGDGWMHEIVVEEFVDEIPGQYYPSCIEGAMNCPPEDCGGIRSFNASMAVLERKDHPDYRDTKRAFPRGYNRSKFHINKVNRDLLKLNRYSSRWNAD